MNFMSFSFDKSSVSVKNEEIVEYSEAQQLNQWTIPEVQPTKIYRLGMFDFISKNAIKTSEQTVCLDTNDKTIKLLSIKDVQRYKQKYQYMHIGLIQVAFKPLTLPGLNSSILADLRDARCNDWKSSLMGIVQTSLCHGPVYFNVYPNLALSLKDRNLFEAVNLHIQTQGYNFLPGSETIAVIYRIHYKVINTMCPNAILRSDPGRTVVVESNLLTTNVAVPRLIDWEEVNFPTSWSIPNAVQPQPVMNNQVDQITQTAEGDVEIRFAPDLISRISLGRSGSVSSRNSFSPYKVSLPTTTLPTASRHSVSELDPTPREAPSEIPFETHIEGIRISEQQIPHGIYSSNASKRPNSPTVSEMAFHL
jgi:hypothetical protein